MPLEIWTKFNQPPLHALKTIGAGRLKGKSDINPQWRYQALTEVFGMCGIGWKFTIDKLWQEAGSNDQVFAFANISLFIKHEGVWSDAIPGNGGSMLIAKESSGLFSSDEAYKMAITDALGTAAKMIGVAADIYLGNFDGAKWLRNNAPPPSNYNCSKEILEAFENAATKDELEAVWNTIPKDARKEYSAAKDEAKERIAHA